MKSGTAILIAALGAVVGVGVYHFFFAKEKDPIRVISNEIRQEAVVREERDIAVWYRTCPSTLGRNPTILLAWPATLSYELSLDAINIQVDGEKLILTLPNAIRLDEPAVATDLIDYLSTRRILTLADEDKFINNEIRKASSIARYITAYLYQNDPDIPKRIANRLDRLATRLASALDVANRDIEIQIPEADIELPKLPDIELCENTALAAGGVPILRQAEEGLSEVDRGSARVNALSFSAAGDAPIKGQHELDDSTPFGVFLLSAPELQVAPGDFVLHGTNEELEEAWNENQDPMIVVAPSDWYVEPESH